MAERFQPPSGIADAKTGQALSDISKSLDSAPRLSFAPVTASAVSVAPGEIKRLNPRSGGMTAVLQTASASNAGMSCALFVSGPGALTVAPASGTINGASQLVFASGTYSLELFSDGSTWLTPGLSNQTVEALAGAGLTSSGATLAVNGSTSITVTGDQVTRAALTGEVTASANSNATAIDRSTTFAWTGRHTFGGEVRYGTLHTEASVAGAFNITLTAGATRILITSTAAATLGTISGAVDGRMCIIEHVRASGAGDLTLTHSLATDGIACQGSANLTLTGNRSGAWLVCRDAVWRVIAHTN